MAFNIASGNRDVFLNRMAFYECWKPYQKPLLLFDSTEKYPFLFNADDTKNNAGLVDSFFNISKW